MKILKPEISIEQYSNPRELTAEDQRLLKEAELAVSGSYAPYSEFHVGAAVLLENGIVIKGSNQENSAYPSGLCAERVALFYAGSQYPGVAVKAIAITAKADHFVVSSPIAPCGACRQVIAETEHRQQSKIRVIMYGQEGSVLATQGIENLLPLTFQEEKLKKKNKK
jgi:cytidine deaminase